MAFALYSRPGLTPDIPKHNARLQGSEICSYTCLCCPWFILDVSLELYNHLLPGCGGGEIESAES